MLFLSLNSCHFSFETTLQRVSWDRLVCVFVCLFFCCLQANAENDDDERGQLSLANHIGVLLTKPAVFNLQLQAWIWPSLLIDFEYTKGVHTSVQKLVQIYFIILLKRFFCCFFCSVRCVTLFNPRVCIKVDIQKDHFIISKIHCFDDFSFLNNSPWKIKLIFHVYQFLNIFADYFFLHIYPTKCFFLNSLGRIWFLKAKLLL